MTMTSAAMSESWTWRSPALGERRTASVPQGRLEYFVRGDGPTLVFAHGWLVNANLWRGVVDALAERFRCFTLDLPLGSHRVAMDAGADLTPNGCGRLLGDVLDALDLRDVTLVGNDTGGVYAQIAVAARPSRVARLVLNASETLFDHFPPTPFESLPALAATPATLGEALSALRDRAVRATPAAYGLLAKRPIDAAASDTYALPCLHDADVLRDASKAMSSASTETLHAAARRLVAEFERPVLFAWSPEDPVFPLEHARRYAAQLRDARVALIEDSYSFAPEDQPRALAAAIARFVDETARG